VHIYEVRKNACVSEGNTIQLPDTSQLMTLLLA